MSKEKENIAYFSIAGGVNDDEITVYPNVIISLKQRLRIRLRIHCILEAVYAYGVIEKRAKKKTNKRRMR